MAVAIELALACHRNPVRLHEAARRPLPADVGLLLRIAAGDRALVERFAETSGERAERLVEAARFFIQQVLFASGGDHYRTLGVDADAGAERIKEHYRWLVSWLHPDRDPDGWDSLYADRVNTAWQALRTPTRREEYDRQLADARDDRRDEPLPDAQAPVRAPLPLPSRRQDLVAASAPADGARPWLPQLVLGTLLVAAMLTLALLWWSEARPAPRIAAAPAPAVAATAPASAPLPTLAAAPAPVVPAPAPAPATEPTPDLADVAPEVDGMAAPLPAPAALPAVAGPTPRPLPAPPPATPPSPRPRIATAPAAAPAPIAAAPAPAPASPPPAPPAAEASPAPVAAPPPTIEATAAAEPAPVAAPGETQARALLQRFSTAYAAGDITALMRLFTRDASNARGGREHIAADYAQLFAGSNSRRLDLRPVGWIARGDEASAIARFDASVYLRGTGEVSRSRGDIRFDLRVEDGELRIHRLRHENDD